MKIIINFIIVVFIKQLMRRFCCAPSGNHNNNSDANFVSSFHDNLYCYYFFFTTRNFDMVSFSDRKKIFLNSTFFTPNGKDKTKILKNKRKNKLKSSFCCRLIRSASSRTLINMQFHPSFTVIRLFFFFVLSTFFFFFHFLMLLHLMHLRLLRKQQQQKFSAKLQSNVFPTSSDCFSFLFLLIFKI